MKKMSLLFSFLICLLGIQSLTALTSPNFTVTTSNNQTFNLYEKLDEGKTVVVKLFFTSCPSCQSISPQVNTLYSQRGSGQDSVEFIALSIFSTETTTQIQNYVSNYNIAYPVAGPSGGSVQAADLYTNGDFGDFLGTPTFIVISPNRNVNFDVRGPGNNGTIAALNAALDASFIDILNPPPTYQQLINVDYHFQSTINYTIEGSSTFPFDLNKFNLFSSEVQATFNGNEPLPKEFTIDTSGFLVPSLIYAVKPKYEGTNYSEGISTIDLVLIAKHILSIDTLDEMQQIAADVNNSGSITTLDLVDMRKLILQIITTLSNNPVFKFLPTTRYFYDNMPNPVTFHFDVVKTGDVSSTVDLGFLNPNEIQIRNKQKLIGYKNHSLKKGEVHEINFNLKDFTLDGIQGSIGFDSDKIKVITMKSQNESCIHYRENEQLVNFAYLKNELNSSEPILKVKIEAIEDINSLSSVISSNIGTKNESNFNNQVSEWTLFEENNTTEEWKLFGNKYLQINTPIFEDQKVSIFTNDGKLIFINTIEKNSSNFELPNLSTKQIYLIHIEDSNKNQVIKWFNN